MKVADIVARILKAEGVEYLFAYPVNHLIEAAAKVDIRTVIVRQERIGLHMADAVGRLSSGKQIGVFCMQHGPGTKMPLAVWPKPMANPHRLWCCPWAIRATSLMSIPTLARP